MYSTEGAAGGGNFEVVSEASIAFSVASARSKVFGQLAKEFEQEQAGAFGAWGKARLKGGAWGGTGALRIQMAVGQKRFGNLRLKV